MPAESRRFRVPATLSGRRLDHVLDVLVEDRSRAQLQKLVRRGRVRLDGKRVTRSNLHVPGRAEIVVEVDAPADSSLPTLDIVYEDDAILVVDKPAGMLTHPADRSSAESVSEVLQARYGPLPTSAGEERPGIVHRLDRETSGLLVVARTEAAMRALRSQFRDQAVEKTYWALVSRVPPERPFWIEEPIGPVPGKPDRQRVTTDGGGRSAATQIERTEVLGRHALVTCRPKTGRRHQIRVHLAHAGFPVIADGLYGTRNQEGLPDGVSAPLRQALHAQGLTLRHPKDGERRSFEAPLPEDLEALLQSLRRATR